MCGEYGWCLHLMHTVGISSVLLRLLALHCLCCLLAAMWLTGCWSAKAVGLVSLRCNAAAQQKHCQAQQAMQHEAAAPMLRLMH